MNAAWIFKQNPVGCWRLGSATYYCADWEVVYTVSCRKRFFHLKFVFCCCCCFCFFVVFCLFLVFLFFLVFFLFVLFFWNAFVSKKTKKNVYFQIYFPYDTCIFRSLGNMCLCILKPAWWHERFQKFLALSFIDPTKLSLNLFKSLIFSVNLKIRSFGIFNSIKKKFRLNPVKHNSAAKRKTSLWHMRKKKNSWESLQKIKNIRIFLSRDKKMYSQAKSTT